MSPWKAALPVLIPILVPAAIAALKSMIPNLNKKWLPVLCPILGVMADSCMALSGAGSFGPQWAAFLGLAGNGLREVYDQWTGNAEKPTLQVRPK